MNNYLNEWKKRNTWWRVFRNFPLIFPSHSSAEQHDDVSWSRLHASPAEQHAAQSSGHQHRQHPQRQRESQQQCKKRKTICVVFYDAYTNWISVCVCVSQMSPFSMNGLPSPGYQCPTSVYQPTPQQVYSLTQTGQQVLNSELAIKKHCEKFLIGGWLVRLLSFCHKGKA